MNYGRAIFFEESVVLDRILVDEADGDGTGGVSSFRLCAVG